MNNINFEGRINFPLSIETMSFMQSMINTSAQIALLGGDNYILTGCAENGLNVESGIVVLHGEILPLTGGPKQEYVYIKESKRSVTASGYNFPDVYKTREIQFGYAENRYKWADFKRIQTNQDLTKAIENITVNIEALRGVPPGVITMWWGSPAAVPEGWALCDGLDGRPNLMGRFVVGYNQNDDDYKTMGKTGGAKEITLSIDQIPAHKHNVRMRQVETDDGGRDWGRAVDVNGTKETSATENTGGGKSHENRPPYIVLAYIIKL